MAVSEDQVIDVRWAGRWARVVQHDGVWNQEMKKRGETQCQVLLPTPW